MEKKNVENEKFRTQIINKAKGSTDSEIWGMKCLELTNKFRKSTAEGHKGGLPALRWSKELHDIALEHSQNMANGKVKFGHGGFKKRSEKVPFPKISFSENVAWNEGLSDPSEFTECAVRGWINSPGHRRNMLATNTLCAIAVFKKGQKYWFT